ncbi:CRISPR-associated protein [Anoxybacillus thermarum]|uniref:CRISPR-associated protein n=1 Tax=Anoxybacillus thermarum TaxID=404937 RepID=A0A0D0S0S1_9BACL|nr:RAMP superfamily CRISPR-associated protein [Anoxybacillus thermarum]KIQ94506.1 CRISPR-associated protein [Anoxybacillus thermarum]
MSEFQPYDYIPISSPIEKKSIEFNENEKRWSGSIKVKMTVITPLIEVKETDHAVQKERGRTIPGSSIRGALRNAAEILWNGTVSVFKEDGRLIREEWKMSNSTIYSHCPVSHLFGFVASEKNKPQTEEFEQRIPSALGSKLKFSQAVLIEETFNGAFIQMNQLYSPRKKPPLRASNDGQKYFLGRKVYLAGRLKNVANTMKIIGSFKRISSFNDRDYFNPNARLNNRTSREYAVFPGTQYIFFIEFSKLTKEELADVLRLLELKEGYYHAIGKGKPLGLGRVRFEVEGIMRKDKSYYLQLDVTDSYDRLLKGKLLQETVNRYEANFHKYYELLEWDKFDNKKSYGSRNKKVYRYSELNNEVKESGVKNKSKKSSMNNSTDLRKTYAKRNKMTY